MKSKNTRRGRPPVAPDRRQDKQLLLRLRGDERATLDALAAEHGVTAQAYVRGILRRHLERHARRGQLSD